MSRSTFFPDPTMPADPGRWDGDVALPERRTNRPVTWQHRLEATFMHGLFSLFDLIGVDRASGFMGGAMRMIGPLVRPVHKRGLANLRLVFPDKDEDELETILKRVWENLGRTLGEYPHLDCFRPFEEGGRVEIENESRLRELADRGRPVVFVSGHLANWEIMAITLYRTGLKTAVVYRAANNPLVDERIIEIRADVMSRYLIPKGKRGGRQLLAAMKDGLSLCMLTDQKLNDGIAVPFMGHDAMTATAAARMALKFDAPVVPLSIRRTGGAHFCMTVHEPLMFEATGEAGPDGDRLTAKINEALGDIIMNNPGQWLWLHRRWPREATETPD